MRLLIWFWEEEECCVSQWYYCYSLWSYRVPRSLSCATTWWVECTVALSLDCIELAWVAFILFLFFSFWHIYDLKNWSVLDRTWVVLILYFWFSQNGNPSVGPFPRFWGFPSSSQVDGGFGTGRVVDNVFFVQTTICDVEYSYIKSTTLLVCFLFCLLRLYRWNTIQEMKTRLRL